MKKNLYLAFFAIALFTAGAVHAATQFTGNTGTVDSPRSWTVSEAEDGTNTFVLLLNELGMVGTDATYPRTDLAYSLVRGSDSFTVDLSQEVANAMAELLSTGKAEISAGMTLNENDVLTFSDGVGGATYDTGEVNGVVGTQELANYTKALENSGLYIETILENEFLGSAYDGSIDLGIIAKIEEDGKVRGQPLPGVITSLLIGAGAMVYSRRRRNGLKKA